MTDRLVVGSYSDTSYIKNALVLMKNNDNGILGLSNLSPTAEDTLPKTTFNIRSTGDAVIRLTAENVGDVVSSLQLLGASNCLSDGCELEYYSASGFADLSMYKDSGKVPFIRTYENNTIGIFTGSGTSNSMVTIGDVIYTDAVLSLHATSGTPTATVNYGKLFIKPKFRTYQSQTEFLLDSSGNIHDLVVNKYDVYDARGLFTDATGGNTFGGYLCPSGRDNLQSASDNTAIVYKSLYVIKSGDKNTTLGSNSASGITTGSKNIVIGYNSAPLLTSANNNIIIGNDEIASVLGGNYNFILGSSSGNVLLQGKSGPSNSDKYLEMPSGGQFIINNNTMESDKYTKKEENQKDNANETFSQIIEKKKRNNGTC